MIAIGALWVTGPWRFEPRQVEILNAPKHPDDGDEIEFMFLDNAQISRCPQRVFTGIYQPMT